jgi:hypothetical protein
LISEQAISYDLQEARRLLGLRASQDASKHLAVLVRDLNLLFRPAGERGTSVAAKLGMRKIQRLRANCLHAIRAIGHKDVRGALALISETQAACDDPGDEETS